MKLNEDQIRELFEFTRRHYVEYYDVQAELVDHLANAIEEKMNEDPNISFDRALQAEFKKFGIFGFMDVVESRQKALAKRYHKIVWKEALNIVSSPKLIVILASLYLCFYGLMNISTSDEIYVVVFLFVILLNIFLSIRDMRRNSKKQQTHQKLLLNEMIHGYGNAATFFVIPVQFISSVWNSESTADNALLSGVLSVLMVLYVLFTYVIRAVIPSKAEAYLRETYPGYELNV